LLGATLLVATAPVPRASSELTFLEPSGKTDVALKFPWQSAGRGILVDELPSLCRVTLVIGKLHKELGPRGFQPIGKPLTMTLAGESNRFFRRLGITYPVGYTSSKAVILLRPEILRQFHVPQM